MTRAIALAIVLLFSAVITAHSRDLDGKYAQADPELKKWFEEQVIPGTKTQCCSQADGAAAEEDIRGKDYWARFEANGVVVQWMKVPEAAVLTTKNLRGVPVVWWTMDEGQYIIRCYAPGPKS